MSESGTFDDRTEDSEMDMASRRVLVVDDEPEQLAVVRRTLVRAGYAVDTAIDGSAALEVLAQGTYDAIVSDLCMPAMGGLELLREVRARDVDAPVLLLTGMPDVETAAKAVEYGAFRYLVKPVDKTVLTDSVHAAARWSKMMRLRREAAHALGDADRWCQDRATVEVAFDRALEQIWIAWQPIISVRDRGVYGYEALVRSDAPRLRNPLHLFEAAERLGRVHDLSRIIRARIAAAAPQAPAGARLFVNVHAQDLNDFELSSPSAPLSQLAPHVVLEITERASLDSVDSLQTRLAKLRQLGFHIAVDDLGSGYAGLSSFSVLEPDVVKLDMSLVRDLDASARKRSVVRSMVRLAARELEMLVVCEGVETAAERDALVGLGADLLQGYFFAKPARDFPSVAAHVFA